MILPPEILDLRHAGLLCTIGFAGGALGGLLGVGGGIVMIPSMIFVLGRPFGDNSLHVFKLASLIASAAVSIPAAMRHLRSGAVIRPLVGRLIPAAVVGMALGILLAQQLVGPQTKILQAAFGGVMIAAAIVNLWQTRKSADDSQAATIGAVPYRSWSAILLTGAPAGALAGLFGIGGGIWAVPILHFIYHVRIRNAIATSSCLIVFISVLTAITQSAAVSSISGLRATDGWWLALAMAPGAALGGWCGALLTHVLPTGILRRVFMAFLAIAGLRMMMA
ncbi:MAG: sulfite exporter TauE/SafE family protein [Phycisphaerales bacterium]|nr:sulfite exporter TauE/SafE family protein [Phycisphaerales bacterium]